MNLYKSHWSPSIHPWYPNVVSVLFIQVVLRMNGQRNLVKLFINDSTTVLNNTRSVRGRVDTVCRWLILSETEGKILISPVWSISLTKTTIFQKFSEESRIVKGVSMFEVLKSFVVFFCKKPFWSGSMFHRPNQEQDRRQRVSSDLIGPWQF